MTYFQSYAKVCYTAILRCFVCGYEIESEKWRGRRAALEDVDEMARDNGWAIEDGQVKCSACKADKD